MTASIISIGDEILIGQVINTNASYIANSLNKIGTIVKRISSIGDEKEIILKILKEQNKKYDIIIITGGLGPTHDDITKKIICEFFKTKLIVDEKVKTNIKRILSLRNMKWSPYADEQSMVPTCCIIIPNEYGTAPGFLFEHKNTKYIFLPGVPYEMKQMMDSFVIPYIKNIQLDNFVAHRTLRTTGIPEIILSDKLGDIRKLTKKTTLAFLPSPTGVNLRISAISN